MNLFSWILHWPRFEKMLYIFSFIVLFISALGLLFLQYQGLQNVVNWDVLSELGEIAVQLDKSATGQLIGKAFVVKEQFVPSLMVINNGFTICYALLVALGWLLFLSAITELPRWGYAAAMTVFIGFLASTHLELLQLFGSTQPLALGIALLLTIVLSYYFHAFRRNTDYWKKALAFGLLLLALVVFCGFSSQTSLPLQTVVSYSLLGMTLLTAAFIFLNSFEIVAALVFVVSNRKTGLGKNSLLNFLFISGLYILTVWLIYLRNTRRIEDNFWLMSPFVLFIVATALGLRGFRQRTQAVLAFEQVGAWLYLAGALASFATIGYAIATNNNPLIEVFEDVIVYGQLTLGTVFVGYVILNFWPLFWQGLEVHKVIYKPLKVTLAQVWTIGLLAAVSFAAFDKFFVYEQTLAGHHNALGDLYTVKKEYILAEQYYKLALNRDPLNHKSNFALASLALQQGDRGTAGVYFKQALRKDASPQAYAGLSRVMLEENLFFDAIFNLRKGLQTFPKSGELQTNLGYFYARTRIADSTFYYLNLAKKQAQRPEVASANLLAFYAENPSITAPQAAEIGTYPSYEANRFAQLRQSDSKASFSVQLPADSALSVNNFAYIYNYATHQRDSTLLPLLKRLEEKEGNGNFYDDLQMARAYVEYYGHDKLVALDLLAAQTVGDTSQKTALARQTLGFWLAKESEDLPFEAVLKTETQAKEALRRSPLRVALLQKNTAFFNQRKQPQVAYQAILNALRFRRNSPAVQQLYIMQCLEMHLTDFAEDGLKDLAALVSAPDYQAFLKTYQAKRQAMQKEQAQF